MLKLTKIPLSPQALQLQGENLVFIFLFRCPQTLTNIFQEITQKRGFRPYKSTAVLLCFDKPHMAFFRFFKLEKDAPDLMNVVIKTACFNVSFLSTLCKYFKKQPRVAVHVFEGYIALIHRHRYTPRHSPQIQKTMLLMILCWLSNNLGSFLLIHRDMWHQENWLAGFSPDAKMTELVFFFKMSQLTLNLKRPLQSPVNN